MLAPTHDFARPATAIAADGTVEGYASLFGEIDQARDMVMRGAFAADAAAARRRAACRCCSSTIRPSRSASGSNCARTIAGFTRAAGSFRKWCGRVNCWRCCGRRHRRAVDRLSHGEGRASIRRRASAGSRRSTLGNFHRHVPAARGGAACALASKRKRPTRTTSEAKYAVPAARFTSRTLADTARSLSRGAVQRATRLSRQKPLSRVRDRERSSCQPGDDPNQRGNTMDIDVPPTLPRPRPAFPHDAVVTHAEMMRAFEAFKAPTTSGSPIERAQATSCIEEKLARIDRAIDAHARRLDEITLEARAAGARRRARRRASRARPSTRRPSTPICAPARAAGLRALEVKAMSVGSNPDGGYLVPVGDRAGDRRSGSPRSRRSARIAGVRTISGNVYKKPFMTAGPAVGWVGETDARTQTDFADARRAVVSGDGALRHAGRDRDAARGFRRRYRRSGSPSEVEQAFAEQEGAAFVNGDGNNKPKGFLSYTTVADGSGTGAISATSRPAPPARSRRAIRPTCWST